MRFSLTFSQHSLLLLFGESDVKMRRPMRVHEFEAVDLEFGPAEPVRSLRDIRELHDPILKRLVQVEPVQIETDLGLTKV